MKFDKATITNDDGNLEMVRLAVDKLQLTANPAFSMRLLEPISSAIFPLPTIATAAIDWTAKLPSMDPDALLYVPDALFQYAVNVSSPIISVAAFETSTYVVILVSHNSGQTQEIKISGAEKFPVMQQRDGSTPDRSLWTASKDVPVSNGSFSATLPAARRSRFTAILQSPKIIPPTTSKWMPEISLASAANYYGLAAKGKTVHAVYGSGGNIMYMVSQDEGKTFSTEKNLGVGQLYLEAPLVVDDAGNVYLTYFKNIRTVSDFIGPRPLGSICMRVSRDGGSTFEPEIALTSSQSGFRQSTVVSGSFVHTVWMDFRAGNWDIYYCRSTNGAKSFEPEKKLVTGTPIGGAERPFIAASGNALHLVWMDGRGNKPPVKIEDDFLIAQGFDVYYKRSLDGGSSWGPDVALTTSPAYSGRPTVACTSNTVVVTFDRGFPDGTKVHAMLSANSGTTWTAPVQLVLTPSDSTHSSMAIGKTAVIHMVWMDRRSGVYNVYYRNSVDLGRTWGAEELVSTTGSAPLIAVSDNFVHVLWQPGSVQIRSRLLGLLPPGPPLPIDPPPSLVPPKMPDAFVFPSASSAAVTKTIVGPNENLQQIIDNTSSGDIVLKAGATWTGSYILRNHPGSDMVRIISSGKLPPFGVRTTPALKSELATILTPSNESTFATDHEAVDRKQAIGHHYELVGLELAPAPGVQNVWDLVCVTGNTRIASQIGPMNIDEVPHDIGLNHCYLHLIPGCMAARGFWPGGKNMWAIDSYFEDIYSNWMEANAIGSHDCVGPLLIQNNYLCGSAESMILGTYDDPKKVSPFPDASTIKMFNPRNIIIRLNHITKNLAWRNMSGAMKNLLEFKHVDGVDIDSNVFEYSWVGAQLGYAVVITPRTNYGQCPWNVTSNVTYRNNIVRHCASGIFLCWKDNYGVQETLTPSLYMKVSNSLFTDISKVYTPSANESWNIGIGMQRGEQIEIDKVTIDCETYGVFMNYPTCAVPTIPFKMTNSRVNAQRPFSGSCGDDPSRIPGGAIFDSNYFPAIASYLQKAASPQAVQLWLDKYPGIMTDNGAGCNMVQLANIESKVRSGDVRSLLA